MNYIIKICSVIVTLLVTLDASAKFANNTNDMNAAVPVNCLPILQSYISNDEKYNYVNFVVESPESTDYYVEFWALPAQYANGEFSSYRVYINGEYVDNISFGMPNWQSAMLEHLDKVTLTTGKNIISIATQTPEIPSVETLQLALEYADANITSDKYDNYLNEALCASSTTDDIKELTPSLNTTSSTETDDLEHQESHTNLALKYSFYTIYSFKKGDEICIKTSSTVNHTLDVFYYGSPIQPIVPNPQSLAQTYSSNRIIDGSTIPGDLPNTDNKPLVKCWNASNAEIEGLNWKGAPEFERTDDKYYITKYIIIPKDGLYLIKPRPIRKGVIHTLDLTINDLYTYEDVPMFFSRVFCGEFSAGHEVAIMTKSDVSSKNDPMLFIHGMVGDHIVGFNDDHNSLVTQNFNLSKRDSYISHTFGFPLSMFSVSNNSSKDPESTCDIIAYKSQGKRFSTRFLKQLVPIDSIIDDDFISTEMTSEFNKPTISASAKLGDNITIKSPKPINKIIISHISGEVIYQCYEQGNILRANSFDLGIRKSGLYIISVITSLGYTSQKIAIN